MGETYIDFVWKALSFFKSSLFVSVAIIINSSSFYSRTANERRWLGLLIIRIALPNDVVFTNRIVNV